MPWHYKSPSTFPALYSNSLRTAAACPDNSVMFMADIDREKVMRVAENFRRFKWCVREREEPKDLFRILDLYDIRTKIVQDELGFILFITACPTKLSEFVRLNPVLAAEILPTL